MTKAEISMMPQALIDEMNFVMGIKRGMCFENCVYAVLGGVLTNTVNSFSELLSSYNGQLKYNLGMLRTYKGDVVGHAWLSHHTKDGVSYWDPTLQFTRSEWRDYNNNFHYLLMKQLTDTEIINWIQEKHPDRPRCNLGIPDGRCSLPSISNFGKFN